MTMTTALLVDDDELLLRLLKFQLEKHKFKCFVAASPKEAERHLSTRTPDIVLLDYDLGPKEKTGLELCRSIKSSNKIPVIMITGNENTQTIVSCLDAGADQYIVKPYVLSELLARIRSVLRLYPRHGHAETQTTFLVHYKELVLDLSVQELRMSTNKVALSNKETAVLEQLMANAEQLVSKEHLSSVIYQQELDPFSRTLDVLIGRVRSKLQCLTDDYLLKTVRNHGYIFLKKPTQNDESN